MLQNSFQKRSTVPKSDSPFHGEVRDPHYLLHQIVLRLNLYGIDFDPFQVVEHLIEYKGAHLVDTQDTREKQNIGELWASKSDGKGLFLMAEKQNSHGQGLMDQITAAFA